MKAILLNPKIISLENKNIDARKGVQSCFWHDFGNSFNWRFLFVILVIFSISIPFVLKAQTVLPSQSPARPLGLNIVGPVYQSGSDSSSAAFNASYLATFNSFLNVNLGNDNAIQSAGGVIIDPGQIPVLNSYSARVYFLGESAGYRNSLGFFLSNPSSGLVTQPEKLIFPSASSVNSSDLGGNTNPIRGRTTSDPLLPGDFVNLGIIPGNSALDFFIIANGANTGSSATTNDVLFARQSLNGDGLAYARAFYLPGSPYLLFSFEDLRGGGDRDFNDLLFAVDLGSTNFSHIITPEPSTFFILALLVSLVLILANHRKHKSL